MDISKCRVFRVIDSQEIQVSVSSALSNHFIGDAYELVITNIVRSACVNPLLSDNCERVITDVVSSALVKSVSIQSFILWVRNPARIDRPSKKENSSHFESILPR
jgi:hypothetical protein